MGEGEEDGDGDVMERSTTPSAASVESPPSEEETTVDEEARGTEGEGDGEDDATAATAGAVDDEEGAAMASPLSAANSARSCSSSVSCLSHVCLRSAYLV